ncbi:tyrosine-type recombinase/integrase [Nonomuraea sp. NPDC049784]|uniref:tyrosine-type recombinase/integrase n=1 Tax=Nonomuraea sp. NPDC049784 TaxID=3154361 RepID=UPI0033F0C890
MTIVLDWLETFPGETWHERWQLSGSDAVGRSWGPADLTPRWRNRITTGLGLMIALRAIRPSYTWMFSSRLLGVYGTYRRLNHADCFTELSERAQRRRFFDHEIEALNVLTRMAIATGKSPLELDLDDFTAYTTARKAADRKISCVPFAYELLREIGGLADAPSTWRQLQARGQLTVAEMVDRYALRCRPVRDVIVHYLIERSAVLDYGSLDNQAHMLANVFWADLERHHPGIASLFLPDEVAHAWKQRVRLLPDGRPRRNFHAALLAVRSFYLDLLQWSLEDPGRWAEWAAPCPISENDIRGYIKENRQRRARMAERTRALAPVLPRLVRSCEQHLDATTRMLDIARATAPGEEFVFEQARYLRIGPRRPGLASPVRLLAQPLDEPGPRFDVKVAEDVAFWTWAAIEVLRRTGVRIEELLELTHLSLRQYQAPTGEMIPLLQISPSKTDIERVIPADPEMVAVLARIIRRIKGADGRVPVLSRYDTHERVFGPPLPHLFQRIWQGRLQAISANMIRELLNTAAARAGIVDVDGTPLRFTPHDFRRVFSTEAVTSGLPIHIAAKLLGHLDLNTTQGYVAVYPAEVIRHYRQFVAERRSQRPSEEYREPTDAEWTEFRDHFSLRKVALGTCHRPYGTPCQHEHACVRCPMLRLDLAQVPRLLQIEDNTRERLAEARQMNWLGEVAALEESLRHIADKKRQADGLREHTSRDESNGTDWVSLRPSAAP